MTLSSKFSTDFFLIWAIIFLISKDFSLFSAVPSLQPSIPIPWRTALRFYWDVFCSLHSPLSLRLLWLLLLWFVFALSKSISYTGFPQMGDNPWGAVTFKRKTQNNVANSVYMERKSAGGFHAVWSPDRCIFLLYSKWEEPSDLAAGGVLEASRVGLGNFYQTVISSIQPSAWGPWVWASDPIWLKPDLLAGGFLVARFRDTMGSNGSVNTLSNRAPFFSPALHSCLCRYWSLQPWPLSSPWHGTPPPSLSSQILTSLGHCLAPLLFFVLCF